MGAHVVPVTGMSYVSDLTDDQWELLEPAFNTQDNRGRTHAADLRTIVDAMLYMAHTGSQWRYQPESLPASPLHWPHLSRQRT